MMNPLCFVTITLHFEIRNSEMYGGNGSVGYSASSFQGVNFSIAQIYRIHGAALLDFIKENPDILKDDSKR